MGGQVQQRRVGRPGKMDVEVAVAVEQDIVRAELLDRCLHRDGIVLIDGRWRGLFQAQVIGRQILGEQVLKGEVGLQFGQRRVKAGSPVERLGHQRPRALVTEAVVKVGGEKVGCSPVRCRFLVVPGGERRIGMLQVGPFQLARIEPVQAHG